MRSHETEARGANQLPRSREYWLASAALFFVLATIIVKSAWIGDDAYIGFRSIDNLLHGYGLRWNVTERVQVFTDPLKLLLLAIPYAITHEIFITAIVFCVVASLGAVFILVRYVSTSEAAGVASMLALMSSKAVIDYSTSGLENPLNYLLVALFCIPLSRPQITRSSVRLLIFIYALVGFNRLDLLLMLFPALAYMLWLAHRERTVTIPTLLRDGVIFSAPLWGWLLFSTIYFGYAFPNTYYAKLYTGIAPAKHMLQGLMYYASQINSDPVTLGLILVAIGVALTNNNLRLKAAAVGLILYLAYIVKIGGDFMAGRFFSVPCFYAVALLVQVRLRPSAWIAFGAIVIGASLTIPKPPLFYDETYTGIVEPEAAKNRPSPVTDRRGVADERGGYFPDTGLLPVLRRDQLAPIHGWARAGLEARRRRVELVAYGTIGLYGYYGGPRMHIVDYYGLGDPLIARLPIYDREHWQVGHYARSIPNGYIESLRTGQNSIEDAAVRELYRVATVLTRDPIWSLSRFTEIVKANLGLYNPLIRSVNGTAIGPPPVDAGAHGGEPIVLGRRAPPGERYEYGSVVSFAVNGDADQYKRTGWSFPEVRGTWTDGPLASLAIPVPASNRPLKLQMRLAGIRDLPALPFQPVDVFVNGEMIGSWQVADRHFFSAPIPARFVEAPGELWIDLYLPKAVSPAELGHNTDARQLGVQCSELSISEVRR